MTFNAIVKHEILTKHPNLHYTYILPPGPFILTSQFAHGNSAPSKNMPRSGPVAAPLKLKAA